MAKNFKAIYEGGNDSSALNQTYFIIKEDTRGVAKACLGANFLYTLSGGGVNFSQPFESSPHRSGRHNNNIIRQKTSTEWSLSTLLNISQKQKDPNATLDQLFSKSVDTGIRTLWESMLGASKRYSYDASFVATLMADAALDTTADANGGKMSFDSSKDPSATFTLFENLDHIAKQASGCFINQVEVSLPGDGQSQLNWSGNAKTVKHAGIGKVSAIVAALDANEITLTDPEEALRFDVGALVMIVKTDGTTRSADTAVPRSVLSSDKTTGKVIIGGAVLADTVATDYLAYWEPASSTFEGIDEPQTGLIGQITIASLPTLSCVRSATLTLNNNHEMVDYCFGTDGLSGPMFVPGGRLEATISLEINLNANLVEFMKRVRSLEGQRLSLRVGPRMTHTGVNDDVPAPTVLEEKHHFLVECPKVLFKVPSISVPETGSIPVTFEGTCLQTALDQADEVGVSYVLPSKVA
jgi:ribosomal protein S11